MKLLIEIEVTQNYGQIDSQVISEIQDFLNDELPNYIEVQNEDGDEVKIEIVNIENVSLIENEQDD